MKKNKKPMVIIGIVVVLCLIVAGIFALTANSAERRLADQLELGQKYLDEMNYEQAIVAFEAAIAIDPKCEEAYLALADIYVAQDNMEKAVEILEEGYSQTSSEIILTKLEEIRNQIEKTEQASAGEDAQGAGTQGSGSGQASEGTQMPGSGEAGSQGQPIVDENDPFVQLVNAPFTDANSFGDVTNLDAAVAYAESHGVVVGDNEFVPGGDLYFYYEDSEYFDEYTEGWVREPFLRVDTTDDLFDNGGSHTIYTYGVDEENPYYSIYTHLGNVDAMTGGSVPPVGGFAGFLAEYECFTVESILETIGLGDEEFMTYVRMDNAGGEYQAETPYGTADIYLFSYAAFDIEGVNRYLSITFPEGSGAPVAQISFSEGVIHSPVYNTDTYYLTVNEESKIEESEY